MELSDAEAEFARVIESIFERHSATLITMAKGAHEVKTFLKQDTVSFAEHNDVQKRLDDFYMSRIGIRMVSVYRYPAPNRHGQLAISFEEVKTKRNTYVTLFSLPVLCLFAYYSSVADWTVPCAKKAVR